jgi:hypothetical protein
MKLIQRSGTIVALLPILLLGICPLQADTVNPDQAGDLLLKAVEAYGGTENWRNKGLLVVHETQRRYEEGGTRVVEMDHYVDTQGRGYRLERVAGGDRQVLGWDGHGFWAVEGGEPGDEALLGEARRTISDAFFRISWPFILMDGGLEPEYAGTDTVDGMATEVVKITYPEDPAAKYFQGHEDAGGEEGHGRHASAERDHGGGHHGDQVYYFHFDSAHRLVKVYFSHHGDGTFETLYPGDYREIDGILLERSRRLLRQDGQKHYDSEFTRMEFRDKADVELFRRPVAAH